jgi:AcrR family transcriptional regulator
MVVSSSLGADLTHEAFVYSADDEYAAVLAPFLSEAIGAGHAAIAVTSADRIRLLREALGSDHREVSFFDADEWYSRPGATLAAWRAELDAHAGAEPVRAIGEITFAGDAAAAARWTRYESLLNRAFADRSAWIVCPYDTRRLPEQIVADARRTHPVVSTGAGRAPSPEHFAEHELGASLSPGLVRAGARLGAAATITAGGDPLDLRRAVTWSARAAGISADVVEDLILAVGEVAAPYASATVRTGHAGGEWFCETAAVGRASGGLPFDENGLGVLIGRLICDRVEVDQGKSSVLVRFVFGAPKASTRERILAAATELFAENGVRATGVKAIIARAGVAKGTFYAQFESKNDLVIAWLKSSPVRWFDSVRAELEARTPSPAERLTLLFDLLGEWLASDDFHGCQILNTALEARLAGPALVELQSEVEEYLRSTAREAGLTDPDGLAAQLLVLVAGTITTATAYRSADRVAAARAAADSLVAARR